MMNALLVEALRMVPSLTRGIAVVYYLQLQSGIIYVGASKDLQQRLDDHCSGQACRTTELDPPVSVLRVEVVTSFAEARSCEAQLKRWSRAKKLALIRGDMVRLQELSRSHD